MKVQAKGVELFYKKSGQGKALILLHGNGEDHHIFDKISEKLENNFTVYAIDSRNHGESTKTTNYDYEVMAEDLGAFIHALKIAPVNIVGFSDGGIISLLLAMKDSGLVEKMALLGVNLKPSDFTDESYQFLKETYEQTQDPLFKLMLEQPNIELTDLKKIKVPSLIIAAENDLYRPELFRELNHALKGSKLMIMQGHSHDSYIVNQDLLYEDLLAFFQ
ncbi:alpha/beta fold hydrolase [Desulfovibrio litoralis]|uniref:Pimeloyl-ACP methyl ester carboxylesterase n=1 Tax=Desulfovibrio litoralis DSM 11393 TaxID=1121455 RepID=A0A1M7S120_9BACT|nr:alpha/beta hydrolase [Desulfovibrio litoralis]SHN52309.1 Pimeloyl-ACP methyl ester carboxylesterase [Desulfovibrio litoralis DSM 11393]